MTRKHTPGPWQHQFSDGRGALSVVSETTWICGELHNPDGAMPADEAVANARLIAAAPELLSTLDYILPYLEELDRIECHLNRKNPTGTAKAQVCINNVRNAIAKAVGQ